MTWPKDNVNQSSAGFGMKKFANLAERGGTGQEGAGRRTGRDRINSLFRSAHFNKAKSP